MSVWITYNCGHAVHHPQFPLNEPTDKCPECRGELDSDDAKWLRENGYIKDAEPCADPHDNTGDDGK